MALALSGCYSTHIHKPTPLWQRPDARYCRCCEPSPTGKQWVLTHLGAEPSSAQFHPKNTLCPLGAEPSSAQFQWNVRDVKAHACICPRACMHQVCAFRQLHPLFPVGNPASSAIWPPLQLESLATLPTSPCCIVLVVQPPARIMTSLFHSLEMPADL